MALVASVLALVLMAAPSRPRQQTVSEPHPVPGTSRLNDVDNPNQVGVFVLIDQPPANADACKDGGWKQFRNPTFKNQGTCVSHGRAAAGSQ